MLGFVLCVVGAFMAGYAQSLHSTASSADDEIIKYAGILGVAPNGSYLAELLSQTNIYIQQNVTSVWVYYLAIDAVTAVCGAILVAAGDRKAKDVESKMAQQSQASR
jgi:hypothetical protein